MVKDQAPYRHEIGHQTMQNTASPGSRSFFPTPCDDTPDHPVATGYSIAMPSKIVMRIVEETGVPQLFETLRDLPGSDLQSLLLELFQARSAVLDLAAISRSGDRLITMPAVANARIMTEFDRIAFDVASDFEALDLSPVSPFGLSRAMGAIDQNSVLTALRNVEVSGDSTTALALECGRRRKGSPCDDVRLCSSQRVIRLQPFDQPGFAPHFRLFCLASAGRDRGSNEFEFQHLREHVRFYLRLFPALHSSGFQMERPLVQVTDHALTEALLVERGVSLDELRHVIRAHRPGGSEKFLSERGVRMPESLSECDSASAERLKLVESHVFTDLRKEFPDAEFQFDLARLEGLGYYPGFCLRISPTAPDGVRYAAIDGGFTNWTARLLQNRKERFIASGIGSQFVCFRYRR